MKKKKRKSKQLNKKLKDFKKFIESNTEDVGTNFTEEAKKIYYGETKSRPIRGETTQEQAEELIEEGSSDSQTSSFGLREKMLEYEKSLVKEFRGLEVFSRQRVKK